MREKSGPIESFGNFATDFTKARISPYRFVQGRTEPSAAAVGAHKLLHSVSGGVDAVYFLLFLAQLSVLSERCASRPHRKWPFNELVKDLNYPRTWEKAF